MEQTAAHDVTSVKKAVNVTANTQLIKEAKALGLNLSSIFEKAISQEVRAAQEKKWREQNQEGIASYNQRIATHGVFGMEHRSF